MVIWVDPSGPTSRKVLRMESRGDFRMDTHGSASIRQGLSAASVLKNLGSGDFSSHDGSLSSCLSSCSERNSSTDLIGGAARAIAMSEDGEVRAMLEDAEVRAVLRKVTINEDLLNMAIQSLGGWERGLQFLMEYIMVWVKQERDSESSSQQPPPPPPSTSASHFSTARDVVLQPSSDASQILSGILGPPSTTQLLDEETRYTPRLKSRKLMTGEPEMGAGLGGLDTEFCPSSFISIPEDCKPEVTSFDMMAPCISQQHIAMPPAEPPPAMTTKAARRHRMTRQRPSFQARAASPLATSPVSVVVGSSWNASAATSPAVTSSAMSGAQTNPARVPVTSAREVRKGRSMELLLQKELRPSDVSHLGRVILPKKAAEQRMPPLATGGGVPMEMEDFDSGHAWNLRYRFWPNNKSRMYVLENTAAFVMSHGLVEGDLLVIYRGLQGGYVLRGLKRTNGRLDAEPEQVEFAHSLAKGPRERQPPLPENGTLVQRRYGCCPPDVSVKEEPVNPDDYPFLNEGVMMSMGPSFESDSSCFQTLDWFPSLTSSFPFEESMVGDDR